jgi:RNA polymerase sigma-70 factor, ECF subfamily
MKVEKLGTVMRDDGMCTPSTRMHARPMILQAPHEAAPTTASDRVLIDQARHDPAAFARIYRMYYERIGSYLLRRIGDRHEAEDAVGEVFLAAYAGLEQFEHRDKPLVCWLYGIATRVVHRRRRSRHLRLESLVGRESAAGDSDQLVETVVDRENAERARRALERLPKKFRDVIALHYLEGLSVDEIAAALDIASGTAKSRLARGRDRLRSILEDPADER